MAYAADDPFRAALARLWIEGLGSTAVPLEAATARPTLLVYVGEIGLAEAAARWPGVPVIAFAEQVPAGVHAVRSVDGEAAAERLFLRLVERDPPTELEHAVPRGVSEVGFDPSLPARIGRYAIVRAAGASGRVLEAFDVTRGQRVAIKRLGAGGATAELRALFLREAAVLAGLSHPSLAPVQEVGDDAVEGPYMVMDWIDGDSLHARLLRGRRFPAKRAARIAEQLARALAHAHAAGVVHRGVRPSHVLLGAKDHVTLVGFGCARVAGSTLTEAFDYLGAATHIAPETFGASPVDHRADQFGLGCTLFAMLSGWSPFAGRDLEDTARRITSAPTPRLGDIGVEVPAKLELIVARLLAKDPADRFLDATAVADALAAVELE